MTLTGLQYKIRQFSKDRSWGLCHTPKNLAMAIASESGELCHLYRWTDEHQATLLENEHAQAAADELADIVIFALRMFDVIGVDPESAILDKMERNAERYPC